MSLKGTAPRAAEGSTQGSPADAPRLPGLALGTCGRPATIGPLWSGEARSTENATGGPAIVVSTQTVLSARDGQGLTGPSLGDAKSLRQELP